MFDAAEKVYKDLVQTAKDVLGPTDTYVAFSLRNLGDFYDERDDFDQAEAAYKQALDVVKTKHGEDDPNVFAFLNYLAHFYWDHGRETEAQEVFNKLRNMKCLPSPTTSRCLVTRLFAFTFTRSPTDQNRIEPVYVGELLPTPKLPQGMHIPFLLPPLLCVVAHSMGNERRCLPRDLLRESVGSLGSHKTGATARC